MSGSIDLLQRFARFVTVKMGLQFRKERLPELAQKMETLGKRQGYQDLQSYLLSVMASPLNQEQMRELAAALTIGETYFLRDPKSYRVFENELLPKLIKSRRGAAKSLRIWSAGCSSGEEPYTVAILLSRALRDLPDWYVTIIGSDINQLALERARKGVYSKWSFRNAPPWLMDYFSRDPDGNYLIKPQIREMVRFVHLNLADPYDVSTPLTSGMDVIFCRNVMLYFTQDLVGKTISRFHDTLRNDGWLFVGPTEVDHQGLPGFVCRHYDGAMVLQKVPIQHKPHCGRTNEEPLPVTTHPAAVIQERGAVSPLPDPKRPAHDTPPLPPPEPSAAAGAPGETSEAGAEALYRAGRYEEAALAALREPEAPETLSLAAHALANLGRLGEARDCCEKALRLDRLSARNHYLLSVIMEHEGDLDGAVTALRRSLYIDHDFLIAYFALGNLCRRRGEAREAEQSFASALRLLQKRDPGETLPDAEGMTVGALAQLIREMTGAAETQD